MIWFIISIVLTIAAFVALGFGKEDSGKTNYYKEPIYELAFKLRKRQFLALLCLLVMLIGCVG